MAIAPYETLQFGHPSYPTTNYKSIGTEKNKRRFKRKDNKVKKDSLNKVSRQIE